MRPTQDDPNAGPSPQLPGESSVAYAMFRKYRDLGRHRTIAGVLRSDAKPSEKKNRRQLEFWSARWSWVERAKVFDAHNEAVAQRARDRARADYAVLWERRRLDSLEDAYTDAKRLRDKASEMLAAPLYESTEQAEDGRTVIKKAGRWNFTSAALMLKISTELAAAAAIAVGEDRPVQSMSPAELDAVEAVMPRAQVDGPPDDGGAAGRGTDGPAMS